MIRCIHQLMPPKVKMPKWMGINGRGDCDKCIPDIKNKDCPGFTPINYKTFIFRWNDNEIIKLNGEL